MNCPECGQEVKAVLGVNIMRHRQGKPYEIRRADAIQCDCGHTRYFNEAVEPLVTAGDPTFEDEWFSTLEKVPADLRLRVNEEVLP